MRRKFPPATQPKKPKIPSAPKKMTGKVSVPPSLDSDMEEEEAPPPPPKKVKNTGGGLPFFNPYGGPKSLR